MTYYMGKEVDRLGVYSAEFATPQDAVAANRMTDFGYGLDGYEVSNILDWWDMAQAAAKALTGDGDSVVMAVLISGEWQAVTNDNDLSDTPTRRYRVVIRKSMDIIGFVEASTSDEAEALAMQATANGTIVPVGWVGNTAPSEIKWCDPT